MKKHFNVEHTLTMVMDKLDLPKTKMNPNKVDLRFINWIFLSDTYNGRDRCADGFENTLILYGNRIVMQWTKRYDNCAGAGSCLEGNNFWQEMFRVSEIYRRIQAIGRAKFFQEDRADFGSIYIYDHILKILTAHPQFKDLEKNLGLSLRKTGDKSFYTVAVSKFYKEGAK